MERLGIPREKDCPAETRTSQIQRQANGINRATADLHDVLSLLENTTIAICCLKPEICDTSQVEGKQPKEDMSPLAEEMQVIASRIDEAVARMRKLVQAIEL